MKSKSKFVEGVGYIPCNAKPNKHRSFRVKKKWFNRYMLTYAGALFTYAAGCNPIYLCDAIIHKAGGDGFDIEFKPSRKLHRLFKMSIFPKSTTKRIYL